MTPKTLRGSAAIPRDGMVKAHAAHMPEEWAQSRSRTRRQGLKIQCGTQEDWQT
jgi:hypothetical protein